ncbi:MAG: GIY-YIG nuclease family protein [Ancalomicrobiaceae bacterium]|nr:GIY-YIG nuclease family protein [Ancalomicrobiaceae bacterium]
MPRVHRCWVDILASQRNGTLYTGVTNDLARRVWEHREGFRKGFTAKYAVVRLVWCEEHRYTNNAIQREKNIKHWPRQWKINLIEAGNPDWDDLYESFIL